jgi:hypothetical protein
MLFLAWTYNYVLLGRMDRIGDTSPLHILQRNCKQAYSVQRAIGLDIGNHNKIVELQRLRSIEPNKVIYLIT